MKYQLDRRNFIIAGGLTALASTRVLGANEMLRVGVIGAGGRMNDLLNAADKAGGYQIAAVSDVYATRRDQRTIEGYRDHPRGLSRTAPAEAGRGHYRLARPLACAYGGRRDRRRHGRLS